MFDSTVPYARQDVYQRIMMSVAGQSGGYFDGCTVMGDGQNMITITRKYVPTWAIVACFLCVGLIMLLFRTTETCSIQFQDVPGGTAIRVSGTLSPEMYNNLQMTLGSMQPR